MRHLWLSLAASAAVLAFGFAGRASAPEGYRVSGPFVHENLAVYFVHGKAGDGPVPLTLDVPPGKFRSLTLREIEKLKSASKTGSAGTKKTA